MFVCLLQTFVNDPEVQEDPQRSKLVLVPQTHLIEPWQQEGTVQRQVIKEQVGVGQYRQVIKEQVGVRQYRDRSLWSR